MFAFALWSSWSDKERLRGAFLILASVSLNYSSLWRLGTFCLAIFNLLLHERPSFLYMKSLISSLHLNVFHIPCNSMYSFVVSVSRGKCVAQYKCNSCPYTRNWELSLCHARRSGMLKEYGLWRSQFLPLKSLCWTKKFLAMWVHAWKNGYFYRKHGKFCWKYVKVT